jgi:hypothetical protein
MQYCVRFGHIALAPPLLSFLFFLTYRQPGRQAVSTRALTVLPVAAGKERSIGLTAVDMDAFKKLKIETQVTTIVFIIQVRRGLKLLVYEALRSA